MFFSVSVIASLCLSMFVFLGHHGPYLAYPTTYIDHTNWCHSILGSNGHQQSSQRESVRRQSRPHHLSQPMSARCSVRAIELSTGLREIQLQISDHLILNCKSIVGTSNKEEPWVGAFSGHCGISWSPICSSIESRHFENTWSVPIIILGTTTSTFQ